MFCWPCIIVYHYSETKVMHSLFSLLRIKGLYMFRALLAHPQEVLHKRHLVYCVRVMSVGCTRTGVKFQSWCSQGTSRWFRYSEHNMTLQLHGLSLISCKNINLPSGTLQVHQNDNDNHKSSIDWSRWRNYYVLQETNSCCKTDRKITNAVYLDSMNKTKNYIL
jgi:hypothetical protein